MRKINKTRIEARLKEMGLSKRKAAEKAGLGGTYIYDILSSDENVSVNLAKMQKLADYLKLDIDDIIQMEKSGSVKSPQIDTGLLEDVITVTLQDLDRRGTVLSHRGLAQLISNLYNLQLLKDSKTDSIENSNGGDLRKSG